jgi:hypothetical protein
MKIYIVISTTQYGSTGMVKAYKNKEKAEKKAVSFNKKHWDHEFAQVKEIELDEVDE